jgi:hypothetical protein
MGKTQGPVIHWINEKTRAYPHAACNTVNKNITVTEEIEKVTCGMCKKSIEKLKNNNKV